MGLAWLFPVGSFVLLPLAFFVSYGIGVSRNDIQKIWPFVSDTGAIPPESCIFGQLLNMSAGLTMVSLYLRHRHIMAYFRATKDKRKRLILTSRIFLCVGIFAAFGLMLVANFQERTIVVVHFVGALIAFALGLVYGWYQTVISFLSPIKLTPRWIAYFRLIICIVGTLCFIGLFARQMDGEYILPDGYNHTSHLHTPTPKAFYRDSYDPGYTAFLVTTVSEWILAMCLALFFLTLAFDLREAQLHPIRLELLYSDEPHTIIVETNESDVEVQVTPIDRKYSNRFKNDHDGYQIRVKEKDHTANGIPLPGLAGIKIKNTTTQDEVEVNYRNQDDDEREEPRRLRRSYDIALHNQDVNFGQDYRNVQPRDTENNRLRKY